MAEQETKTLITWEEGPFGGFDGKAGDVRLFSVNWRTKRGEPDWEMRSSLPGIASKRWKSDDREELYRKAEKALATWLARVSQTAKDCDENSEGSTDPGEPTAARFADFYSVTYGNLGSGARGLTVFTDESMQIRPVSDRKVIIVRA